MKLHDSAVISVFFAFAASLASPASAQGLSTEIVVTGLSSPLDLESPPGDSRLFIAEQSGRIRIVENGVLLGTPYYDGSGLVAFGSFTGLRGIAFHPDYANNGYCYIAYDEVTSGAGDVVIDRLTVMGGNANQANPASRVEIMRVSQTFAWHGGGDMAFGSDGFFYTAFGDGHGQGFDPHCAAQDGSTLRGKMVRLDLDSAFPYAIPASNPFVGNGSVLDEVWALGMRHPWRWSFDSANGDLYIADVGQSGQEEIDFIAAGTSGQNFGWKVMEGTLCNSTSACGAVAPCNDSSYTDPIFTQPTGLNCSITGGFVYRGSAIPAEQGNYFFGAYCSGAVWTFGYDGVSVSGLTQRNSELGMNFTNLTSFGQDAFGELYLIQQNGTVRKIVPECPPPTNYCTGALNSSGTNAVMGSFGSQSVSANGFNLTCDQAVPNITGLFFFGPNQISIPFGDGFQCVGGGITRMPPVSFTDLFGSTQKSVDFTSAPGNTITPGSTWNFQYWYRDTMAGMSGFNTSDGLNVEFCP